MSIDRRALLRGSGVTALGLIGLGHLAGPAAATGAHTAATDLPGGGPTDGVTRTLLQHFEAPAKGWDIYQTRVEIPVGKQSGRHLHPTGPEVGYLIRGDVAMEFDDRPTQILRTGDPFHIPPDVIHNAVNIGVVTTMMLSTYVILHDQPLVINQ
ncbi:cupin domain-containing protein [Kribbella sp. NPDC051587]|uniref:cupin domain-containing protein n=1 Tax=Kribbella sp. NPDC051587 TaxID=3364119 RepID=UPI00379AF92E